ncbi:hypothetical protein PVK06_027179 [Gossypium arboreum]|uniref:Uncharacterized protein n=1 Tax=Gossypium arboreum TaxID=29729 RepID=A0ABR0NZL2_GOSAR|nr:hypothetical protein PVK06_027179 [Gossypium arboreum]
MAIEEYSAFLHYDFRDPLRIYWKQNVDFRGPLANLMGLHVNMVKSRLKDKNGLYISRFDIWMLWEGPTGGRFSSRPGILEKIRRDKHQVGLKLELAIKNLFQPFPLENVYPVDTNRLGKSRVVYKMPDRLRRSIINLV